MQQENSALRRDTLFDDATRCEDDGLVEKLLGEFPMMGGGPAADVAVIEERWYEDPGIGDDLFAAS